MKIHVYQQDIDNGQKENICHCPIALAVKRTMKVDVVYVDNEIFSPFNFRVKSPEAARIFMRDFDLGLPVKPFSFDVKLEK